MVPAPPLLTSCHRHSSHRPSERVGRGGSRAGRVVAAATPGRATRFAGAIRRRGAIAHDFIIPVGADHSAITSWSGRRAGESQGEGKLRAVRPTGLSFNDSIVGRVRGMKGAAS